MDDLMDTDETRNMLTKLKGECGEKDDQIKMLENTIATLRSMDTKAKVDIDRSWAEIKKSREKLDEEEIKQEKRVAAMVAQDRLKLKNEFEKLTKEYDRSYAERRKELEDEGILMKAEKKQLVATVEAQSKSFEAQYKKLNGAVEQCDLWKRATESFKQEKHHLEKELQVIKDQLALKPKPQEYLYAS
jgi:chromosome segregation ATPase